MSENVKPCPFCGGEAWIDERDGGWMVLHSCGFVDPCWFETRADAVAEWNTRAERTCENAGHYLDNTRFKCSVCDYNGWVKHSDDGRDEVPRYCPGCGAKVVE